MGVWSMNIPIILHFFENGYISSIYEQCLEPYNIKKHSTAYSIGQEIIRHTCLEFSVPKEMAFAIFELIKKRNQTLNEFHTEMLALFGKPLLVKDSFFGMARIYIDTVAKTLYNIHTLYEQENSFMQITNHGNFTLRASHFYVHNSVQEEILALIELLTAKPLGENYLVSNRKEEKSIIFKAPKITFKLDETRGTELNKKIYRYDRRNSTNGDFVRLKVLQADRLGVVPCVALCRYLARFLEAMTVGSPEKNNSQVEKQLQQYNFEFLTQKAFNVPAVRGVFE